MTSVGEVNDFALAVTRAAGPSGGKEDLIRRATQVDPRSAVAVDAGLKAAITLETEGKRLSIFHVLGSGETSGGQAAVDSFVTIKKAILAVYNATTQYTGIVERRWITPGELPADLAEKAARQALEDSLNAITAEADRMCGHEPVPPADWPPDARA